MGAQPHIPGQQLPEQLGIHLDQTAVDDPKIRAGTNVFPFCDVESTLLLLRVLSSIG
jgi:hypothetical protein